MERRSRRSFLKQAAKVMAVGAGGVTMGLSSESPAQACAIYCTGNVTNNAAYRPCPWCGLNKNHLYLYQKTCRSACGGTIRICSSRSGGFCYSRNVC